MVKVMMRDSKFEVDTKSATVCGMCALDDVGCLEGRCRYVDDIVLMTSRLRLNKNDTMRATSRAWMPTRTWSYRA